MGTLGNKREFNRLLCSCWQATCLEWVVISLVVQGAAAGVWSERLGANTAVVLHSGQQVKLWLWGLQTGDSNTLVELNWHVMIEYDRTSKDHRTMQSYRATTQIRPGASFVKMF